MKYDYQTAMPDRYGILKEHAINHRKRMTPSEEMLWNALRNLKGIRFRREHPIGDYIADFVCLSAKLIIEVDGGYHDHQRQQDEDRMRTTDLNETGFSVIRFSNEDIDRNLNQVLNIIKDRINIIV